MVNFQHWVLGIFLGCIAFALLYLALGMHRRRKEEEAEREEREILFGEEEKNPMPPLLMVVFVGVIIFALGYFILIGIQGPPF